jgi:hypothetical protein
MGGTSPVAPSDGIDVVLKTLAMQPRSGATLLGIPLEALMNDVQDYNRSKLGRRAHIATIFDGESDFRPCADDTIEKAETSARRGMLSNPIVRTTPIGIGLGVPELDKVAIAGGSGQAKIIDTSANVADATKRMVTALRSAAMSCDIPIADDIRKSPTFNPNLVNIRTRLANGQTPLLARVQSDGVCAGSSSVEGWYYDDPSNPTKIMLCPATCESLALDDGPVVTLLQGCRPIAIPPP